MDVTGVALSAGSGSAISRSYGEAGGPTRLVLLSRSGFTDELVQEAKGSPGVELARASDSDTRGALLSPSQRDLCAPNAVVVSPDETFLEKVVKVVTRPRASAPLREPKRPEKPWNCWAPCGLDAR